MSFQANMSQDSVMPKIDVNKELNGSAQLNYMKLMEKENMERVRKLKRIRHRNLLTGLLLTGGVFSICILCAGSSFSSKFPRVLNEKRTDLNFVFLLDAYSMFAVKQENFLDDLDEPLPK